MNKKLFIKMFDTSNNRRYFLVSLIFVVVIISGVLRIFTFSSGIYNYDVYDFVEDIIWTKVSINAKSVIDPEYIYYYIVPFGPNLLMAPFVMFLGPGLLANQLGMLVYFLLYLFILYRLSASIYHEKIQRLLFCSIVSLFIYTYIGDNLLHHLLCYGIGFICYLGELSCALQIFHHKNEKKNLFLFGVLSLWCSLNGAASAVLANIPILLCLLFGFYQNKTYLDKRKQMILFNVVVTTVIGLLIFRYFDNKALTLNMYEARYTLTSADNIVKNLLLALPADYLRIFYCDKKGVGFFTAEGVYFFIKLLFAVLVFVFSAIFGFCEKKKKRIETNNNRFLLLGSAIFIILVCIFQCVFSEITSSRCLFNGVLCLFIICALYITDNIDNVCKLFLPLLSTFVMLMGCKIMFINIPSGKEKQMEYVNLADVIEDHGLSYGYSLVWEYTVLDVLSDGEIVNRHIVYDESIGYFYVNANRIYVSEQKKPKEVEQFYVLSDIPFNSESEYYVLLKETSREYISYDKYTVYVYDISDWDRLFVER